MNIAELFVNIGVKGGEAIGKTLGSVKTGLASIAESSLAAKAAVLGVVIGLERLTGFASQAGMQLSKFQTLTGGSTDELQKWQYALGRFDVSAEETQGTLTHLQSAMADMKLTGQAPAGLNMLANTVGFDPKKSDDMFYVMGKIQEFLKSQPTAMGNQIAKTFGLSENMIQGMRLMNLEKDKIAKGNIINPGEIQRLTQINKAWKDFWFTLRSMGIKFVAAEGIAGIHALMGAFKALMAAGKYVSDLVKRFEILKYVLIGIGAVIGIAFAPLTTIITGLILLLSDIQKFREGKDSVIGTVANKVQGFFGGGTEGKKKGEEGGGIFSSLFGGGKENAASKLVTPPMPNETSNQKGSDYNVTNTFNIDGANSSPKEIANESSKSIDRTFRQMSAQTGGI